MELAVLNKLSVRNDSSNNLSHSDIGNSRSRLDMLDLKLFFNVCIACSVEFYWWVWEGTYWNLVLIFAVVFFNYPPTSRTWTKSSRPCDPLLPWWRRNSSIIPPQISLDQKWIKQYKPTTSGVNTSCNCQNWSISNDKWLPLNKIIEILNVYHKYTNFLLYSTPQLKIP